MCRHRPLYLATFHRHSNHHTGVLQLIYFLLQQRWPLHHCTESIHKDCYNRILRLVKDYAAILGDQFSLSGRPLSTLPSCLVSWLSWPLSLSLSLDNTGYTECVHWQKPARLGVEGNWSSNSHLQTLLPSLSLLLCLSVCLPVCASLSLFLSPLFWKLCVGNRALCSTANVQH